MLAKISSLISTGNGVILPNTTEWYQIHIIENPGLTFVSNRVANEIPINVTKRVLASLASVLEAHFAITASAFASTQSRSLKLLLLNCRIQFEQLNNVWRRLAGRVPCVTDTVKSHQILHYPIQFKEVGIHPAAWDSSQGEKQHGFMKKLWTRISKRGGVSVIELLWKHVTYDRAGRLYDKRVRGTTCVDEATSNSDDFVDSDAEDEDGVESPVQNEDTRFKVNAVLGCQDIQCVNKYFRLCACVASVSCTTNSACNKPLHKLCIHPFICGRASSLAGSRGESSPSMLYNLLEYHMKNCGDPTTSFLIKFSLKGDNRISVRLLKGVKVICEDKSTGMHDYHIRATNLLPFGLLSETSKFMQAFSIVKALIRNVDGTSCEWFVKVMAIVKMRDLTNSKNQSIVLVVALLQEQAVRSVASRYYPYSEYSYHLDMRNNIDIRVTSLQSVIAPAYAISIDNTSSFITESLNNLHRRMYIISFSRMSNALNNLGYEEMSRLYPDIFYSTAKMDREAEALKNFDIVESDDGESDEDEEIEDDT